MRQKGESVDVICATKSISDLFPSELSLELAGSPALVTHRFGHPLTSCSCPSGSELTGLPTGQCSRASIEGLLVQQGVDTGDAGPFPLSLCLQKASAVSSSTVTVSPTCICGEIGSNHLCRTRHACTKFGSISLVHKTRRQRNATGFGAHRTQVADFRGLRAVAGSTADGGRASLPWEMLARMEVSWVNRVQRALLTSAADVTTSSRHYRAAICGYIVGG